MTQLRDYQQDLLAGVQVALASEQARVMMQLPTGGGKTVIAGALLKEWLKGGRRAVWLTHRKELVAQTRDLLANANVSARVDARWRPGDDAPARRNGVAILMAQTVGRRTANMNVWRRYGSDDLMIIDEAHHSAADGWTRAMRQWPGRILGMTATPWRLSYKEGFDHLFSALLCGPPVLDLQSGDHLCGVQVRMPSQEWIVRGGAVGMDGDFTESGIEEANQIDVMTAGAFKFWQEHAQDRQTIVYAVSVHHAHNLAAVFASTGVPAAVMLGDTKDEERASRIAAFKRGTLKVLVNVAVATEGFDLPDASCVVITRPTKSLTLYLQMVGRGLRPKTDGGNCLILDMAANSELHGLPEDDRAWSLEPREAHQVDGDAVTVWCDRCKTVSPAASHHCQNCGAPFGKDCNRCGKWRAWKRWRLEKQCGDAHDLVCDLCHRDAHIEAELPINERLEAVLAELEDEEVEMSSLSNVELDGENEMLEMLELEYDPGLVEELKYWQERLELERSSLEGELGPDLAKDFDRLMLFRLLKELLEEERLKVIGADEERQHELRKAVEEREVQLADESSLEILYEEYVATLPANQRPKNKYRMYVDWEDNLKSELVGWKNELARLEKQPIDKQLIFEAAMHRLIDVFCRAAQEIDLLAGVHDLGSRVNRDPPQSKNGSKTVRRVLQKPSESLVLQRPSSGRRRGAGKERKEASEVAKRVKAAGGSYAEIEKELAKRGFKNTRGKPYRGVSAIYSLLNL